jgi:Fic family protein
MNELKGHRVEVLDTKTNETRYYNTIREVGRALGCTHETVRRALKHLEKTGEHKLILNKRYKVINK